MEITVIRKPRVQWFNTFKWDWESIEFDTTQDAKDHYIKLYRMGIHCKLDYGQVRMTRAGANGARDDSPATGSSPGLR